VVTAEQPLVRRTEIVRRRRHTPNRPCQ
jgi:hypothetical protein